MSFKRSQASLNTQKNIVLLLVSALLIIEVINFFTARSLNHFGLLPRDVSSLYGVFTSPFLHGSIWHFVANIVPFTLFAILLLQHGLIRFWLVSLFVVVVGGLGVWALGRDAIHIGASGVIYGYFGYLILAGLLSREIKLLLAAIFVGSTYSGMIFGILPSMPLVSWEAHLFGFVAGIWAALLWGRVAKAPEQSLEIK